MGKEEDPKWARHRSQFNVDPFAERPSADHYSFPLVDAQQLADRAANKDSPADNPRPRRVRMLARDFIDDSLYNPVYGYFSRHAVLLPDPSSAPSSGEVGAVSEQKGTGSSSSRSGFHFAEFSNDREFSAAVESRYLAFEDTLPLGPSSPSSRHAKSHPSSLSALGSSAAAAQLARARPRDQIQNKSSANFRVGSAEDLEERQRRGREEVARQAQAERDRQLGIKKDHEESHEADVRAMAARQVWHTPTELFKPHYAQAVARYLCAEYKLTLYPYEDLVIYELGAGSGALAHDILAYLRDEEPDVFQRTRYVISEISERLSQQQKAKLEPFAGKVRVVNQNFLEWKDTVLAPCFVIALEVLDNLTHDVVRYSTSTLQPYQGLVSIDATGDMEDLYEPVRDPLISRYLQLSRAVRGTAVPISAPRHLTSLPSSIRKVLSEHFPLYPNLTPPQYIPTGQLRLLDVLRSKFPQHRLIASDFHSLPDAIEGVDAPVVQTRLNGTMVPVTTFKVLQGFFDIFFPTNFQMLRDIYTRVMSDHFPTQPPQDQDATSHSAPTFRPDFFYSSARASRGRAQRVKILTHAQFLEQYAQVDQTRLRDGSNPLLGWYQNASWILT
ncbi:hypothetical protein CBOM_04074 [Ceraceosorus bombacis]|uniref:type II protein arginine methyltransferase n=1 Tax=Ceraceosorus bombacis TaxID=401625 RepID=A0A0P1BPG8_9BASI|nr:hypothetical protein CBOM_04074 [Ceraceosorus bombacis]